MRVGEHLLERRAVVPRSLPEVFAFFSDARNLERITPDGLSLEIVEVPDRLVVGSRIRYRLRLGRLSLGWRTLISVWEPPHRFVDVQERGPYALWEHEHRFLSLGEETEMVDRVRYRLPLWPLGEIAHPLVRRRLEAIFDFRAQSLRELFAGPDGESGSSW